MLLAYITRLYIITIHTAVKIKCIFQNEKDSMIIEFFLWNDYSVDKFMEVSHNNHYLKKTEIQCKRWRGGGYDEH